MRSQFILIALMCLILSGLAFAATSVTVVFPNGGQNYNWALTSQDTIDGNFRINSNDANAFLVDFNLSTVTTQGTGTVILNDQNTFDSSYIIGCSGLRDFNLGGVGRDCNFSIPINNKVADGNYYLNISANAASAGYDSSNATIGVYSAYVPSYETGDIDDISIDLVGTLLVGITSNASVLVSVIIVLYAVGVLTGVIRGTFNIFKGFGIGQ